MHTSLLLGRISLEKRFEGPVSASTHVRLWEGEGEGKGKGKGKKNKEAEDRWSDRIVEVGTKTVGRRWRRRRRLECVGTYRYLP